MLNIPYIQTDVFIDDNYEFSGNQLATFWNSNINAKLSLEQMQGLAREMNFSESTFIFPPEDNTCSSKVRIFTPDAELPFAGHPTLGTAFVLNHKDLIPTNTTEINLQLGVGAIKVYFSPNDVISMFQPKPSFLEKFEKLDILAKILGLTKDDFSSLTQPQYVSTGLPFLIVPLNSLSAIQHIDLNLQILIKELKGYPSMNILVFCLETIYNDNNVHTRMFAPSVGVLEDPATGSAAGPLGAFLEAHEFLVDHKYGDTFSIEQGYEIKRPSILYTQVQYDNNSITGIKVSGKVKATAEGTFYL